MIIDTKYFCKTCRKRIAAHNKERHIAQHRASNKMTAKRAQGKTFNLKDAADLVGKSEATLRRMVKSGSLATQPRKVGNEPYQVTSAQLEDAGFVLPSAFASKTDKGRLRNKAKIELQFVLDCAYCKRRGTHDRGPDGLFWNMDHIVPWSVGEIESLENYVKSCHTCNAAKRDKVMYPTKDTITASHLPFGATSLFKYLISIGEKPDMGSAVAGSRPNKAEVIRMTVWDAIDAADTFDYDLLEKVLEELVGLVTEDLT